MESKNKKLCSSSRRFLTTWLWVLSKEALLCLVYNRGYTLINLIKKSIQCDLRGFTKHSCRSILSASHGSQSRNLPSLLLSFPVGKTMLQREKGIFPKVYRRHERAKMRPKSFLSLWAWKFKAWTHSVGNHYPLFQLLILNICGLISLGEHSIQYLFTD